MTWGRPRYVSNEDLARMQARFAHGGGAEVGSDHHNGTGIKRRPRDNSAAKDLAAEVHGMVGEAIALAETSAQREARLKAAGSRRPNEVRR